MLWPILVIAVIAAGGATITLRALHGLTTNGTGSHRIGVAPGNPFRVGSTILICEDPSRPDMNWYGTVLATRGGMLTVRDISSPYSTVDLEKMYAFPMNTNLGW